MPKRPPLVWLKGEGNYTKANRSPRSIRYVVIHSTEGAFWPSVRWLQSEHSHASSHYIISRGGKIVQLVHDSDIAWHAGNMAINRASIGIEHEGFASDPTGFPDAQYKASARLAAYIARRSVMPIDRSRFIGHSEVPDPFRRPGRVGGADGHTDPGPYWNWSKYLKLVRKYATTAKPKPKPVRVTVASASLRQGQVVKGKVRWRAKTTGPVQKVEVAINGKVRLRDRKAPFGGPFETRGLKNGRHTVELRAHGPRGAKATTRFRLVVRNAPLVVRASVPREVAGVIPVQAKMKGGQAKRVLLFLNGKQIDHDTSRPFVFRFNSARVPNGKHELELRATDRFGRAASRKLTVQVVNPVIASQTVADGVWRVQTSGRVDRVELLVDGALRATLTAPPYAWPLDGVDPAAQALVARAIGRNGSVAEAKLAP